MEKKEMTDFVGKNVGIYGHNGGELAKGTLKEIKENSVLITDRYNDKSGGGPGQWYASPIDGNALIEINSISMIKELKWEESESIKLARLQQLTKDLRKERN